MNRKASSRRRFIQNSSLATAGLLSLRFAPNGLVRLFSGGQPVHNIPANKNFDPGWLKSLYERGKATTYLKTRNELKYIGMPAGGLHAGTVYLGGDGRLWLWGIYNDDREGIDPKTVLWNDGNKEVKVLSRDGACYIEPAIAENKRVLEQGFAIKIVYGEKTVIKELNEKDWDEIAFEATYPIATIRYSSHDLPVEVIVKAGGLFIPLDADNSALPATVFSISIKNKTERKITVSIVGWFENGARKLSGLGTNGVKQNSARLNEKYSSIFSDFKTSTNDSDTHPDGGSTCISFVGTGAQINTAAEPWPVNNNMFSKKNETATEKSGADKLVGSIAGSQTIEPAKSINAHYVLSWHFNHPLSKLDKLKEIKEGYYYGKRFKDASEIAAYIAENFEQLYGQALRWQDAYYDSTLPHWFLERTFLNIATLATANTYRFANNRFWGWEGVNSCEGTCTHVWQYAQAMARVFPHLEKDTRERTDLGIAMQENGGIIFRAEYESRVAIDGQAGTILRIYREHQMSSDHSFLKANWEKIKKAVSFMLAQDKNGDGMTDTPLENTLDAVWEGEIAWIVGLCIAAAKAGEKMAEEMNDTSFAALCREYCDKGSRNMAEKLFNGEYFIHRPDAVQGRKKLGSYNTCHIDQVYGQSWAFQVGLGRLWDKEKTLSALRSLWKYNFAPDVGPYIKTHTGGRPYALRGEAGMVMNTNPKNEINPYGENVTWQLGYFHECMSGFEHQVASHLMAEGMTDEALILTRAIHDRYHAAKRNPFNEIECSDHYARAMASYGTFITATGFEYHGPKGYVRFAPKWNREDFKVAFISAEGWGSYSQKKSGNSQTHFVELKYGSVQLSTLSFEKVVALKVASVLLTRGTEKIPARFSQTDTDIHIELNSPIRIQTGQSLNIAIT